MSRMLEALKALESRQAAGRVAELAAPIATTAPAPWQLDSSAAWQPDSSVVIASAIDELERLTALDTLELAEARSPRADPAFEVCTLPLVAEVSEHYREMAEGIERQLASIYCNVLLFVGVDRWIEPAFSMIHLAQAFAERSDGDVLLVDGDLRYGRLSKSVARPGPGMSEAMLGRAAWTDIIHPTQAARIDFVTAGNAQVPTVERGEFGWSALRPLYRFVLIGPSHSLQPETLWLGGRCDAVYLALSRPHARRSAASEAINSLRANGANVMGSIVVND